MYQVARQMRLEILVQVKYVRQSLTLLYVLKVSQEIYNVWMAENLKVSVQIAHNVTLENALFMVIMLPRFATL